jgi:GDPmannose 4,6-dehydratase
MKKVIITGVTGMDGSHMADYLLDLREYKVYGMIRRSSKPDYSNLKDALQHPSFELVVGDLSDSHSINSLVEQIKPDYFINFAAQSFVGSSWAIPEQTFDINATGVLRCLEAIRKYAPSCRFYNAGSSEEWGNVAYSPQDEKHPLRPRSPYGASKAAARHLVKVYRESYNLYAIQGQLFNHESRRRGEEFVTQKIAQGVARIADAIKNRESFEPIELGNLDASRDWSHAEDFVDGIWKMLNQELPRNFNMLFISGEDFWDTNKEITSKQLKEYVLSSNETHTVREFVELAFEAAGIKGSWMKGENPEEEKYITFGHGQLTRDCKPLVVINPKFYRPAEVDLLWGDSTLARKDLKWSPQFSFEELVEEMVQSALEKYHE